MPWKTETEFTRAVCDSWKAVGAIVVPNIAGLRVSSIPDRTIIWKYGPWFIELKGVRTPIKTGQKIWMERTNLRYPCAIILRAPGILQSPDGTELATGLDPTGAESSDGIRLTLEEIKKCFDEVPWVLAGTTQRFWLDRLAR